MQGFLPKSKWNWKAGGNFADINAISSSGRQNGDYTIIDSLNYIMIATHVEYSLVVAMELRDIRTQLCSIFECDTLERDYEDTWEWLEGYGKICHCLINVRREHNWKTGEYDKPLTISLVSTNFISFNTFNDFGKKLAAIFKTEVQFRQIEQHPAELKFVNETQFSPE